jgi:hypothetical protein
VEFIIISPKAVLKKPKNKTLTRIRIENKIFLMEERPTKNSLMQLINLIQPKLKQTYGIMGSWMALFRLFFLLRSLDKSLRSGEKAFRDICTGL